jgi:hypothetical protein
MQLMCTVLQKTQLRRIPTLLTVYYFGLPISYKSQTYFFHSTLQNLKGGNSFNDLRLLSTIRYLYSPFLQVLHNIKTFEFEKFRPFLSRGISMPTNISIQFIAEHYNYTTISSKLILFNICYFLRLSFQ